MFKHNKKNEIEIKRGLLTIVFLVITVFVAFQAVRLNNPMLMMLVFGLPLFPRLMGNPSALLTALFLANASSLTLPGLPGGLTLVHLFQSLVIGWSIIDAALSKNRSKQKDPSSRILLFFILNMLLIIAVRGFGIGGTSGGSTYGGGSYIRLTISLLFYAAAIRISLGEKHVRLIFFGTLICSFIPFLAQASVYVTGGATSYITSFIGRSSVAEVMDVLESGEGVVRWRGAGDIGNALMTIALVLPAIKKRKMILWGGVGLAFFLTLITGFRGRVVGMGAILFIWMIYDSKNKKQTFFGLLALGVIGWVVALAILPILPLNAQRALSFLPLAEARITDQIMLRAAQGSIDFRLEIWDIAWRKLPQYLLIGRGFAEDITQYAWLQAHWYQTADFYYFMHNYHSGPLSLLMDFGLAGLFLGVAFMWVVAVEAVKGVRQFCVNRSDLVSRYYAFLTIRFVYSCISYFFIYGDVRESFPSMILVAVQLKIFGQYFRNSLIKDEKLKNCLK